MPIVYAELRRLAARHAPTAADADDLLQDALLVALAAGRADLDQPADRAWLAGVLRNQARMAARGAHRRRRREARWQTERPTPSEPSVEPPLPRLPPSLRVVAALG
jgi:DNA-directed RNA polymerase specialized sigma24 family protein